MDRAWYHRLLYGAIDHGRFVENRWKGVLPELALTDSIGKRSPLDLKLFKVHTPRKIDIFYLAGVVFLVLMTLATELVVKPIDSSATKGLQAVPASSPREHSCQFFGPLL
jgi:hypothetical protein